jgi:hypothetical protein
MGVSSFLVEGETLAARPATAAQQHRTGKIGYPGQPRRLIKSLRNNLRGMQRRKRVERRLGRQAFRVFGGH